MAGQAQTSSRRLGRYLPWAVLAVGLAVTISAWRVTATHEQSEVGWATQLAAKSIQTDLITDMEWQRIGLDRLALLWEAADNPQQLWINNAKLYIQHRPGCVAVEWLGIAGDKRIVVTRDKAAPPLAFGGLPREAMENARNAREPRFSAPGAVGDGYDSQYAIVHPVYANDRLRGFVVSFFDVAQSIDATLSDVTHLGFSFAVALPGQPAFTLPGTNREHEQDWGVSLAVPFPGVIWQLRVWPEPNAVNRIKSALPQMTLVLGTVLSLLAFLTVYFAVRVARSSARTKLANEALQREIAVREVAEKELRRAHDELDKRVQERTAELAGANVLLQREVSDHERAEDSLRELTGRLFRVQDEERRRLARELHDGATQDLVALSMDMAMIRDAVPAADAATKELVSGCARLVRHCTEELRTVSYLLHPPLLNELGLASALRDFVEGFASRSGIQVTLNVDPELGRFGQQLELTVFRVVQEALSNVHRHAHSRTASITLIQRSDFLHLEIADTGRGIPAEVLSASGSAQVGMGIAGMEERVRLLGGQLDIKTGAAGTSIEAVLPASYLSMRKVVAIDGEASSGKSVAAA